MGYQLKVGVLQTPHLSKGGVLMVELLTHIYTGRPELILKDSGRPVHMCISKLTNGK